MLGRIDEAEPHLAEARGLRGVDVGEPHVWLQPTPSGRVNLRLGRQTATPAGRATV